MSAFPPPLIMSEPPPDFVDENMPPDDDDYGDFDISESIDEQLGPSPPPLDLSKLDNDDSLSLNIENPDDFEFSAFSYTCPSFDPPPMDLVNDSPPPPSPLRLKSENIPTSTIQPTLSLSDEKSSSDNSSSPIDEEVNDCQTTTTSPPSFELETNVVDLEKLANCNNRLEIEDNRCEVNENENANEAVLEIETVILDKVVEVVESENEEQQEEMEVKETRQPDLLENLPVTNQSEPEREQNNNKNIESANAVRPDVVETVSDDEFDDFTDFKMATVEDVPATKPPISNIVEPSNDFGSFQADFSQFECNFPNTMEATIVGIAEKTEPKVDTVVVNDDDEFGDFNDFNDFQQSTTVEEPKEPVYQPLHLMVDNFKTIIDVMFPNCEDGGSRVVQSSVTSYEEEGRKDDCSILSSLTDFEGSKAVSYQYLNSKSSHSLLKALCIDTRNILYGVKWKSNMPRFAADLSSNPLQPIKTSAPAVMKPQLTAPAKIDPVKAPTTASSLNEVPAVFDWNSAGLVNPLDGVQEIINEETKHQKPDQLENAVLDEPPTTTKIGDHPAPVSQQPQQHHVYAGEKDKKIIEPTPVQTKVIDRDDRFDVSPPLQPTYDANRSIVRTIKLPETHIFTPIKSTSAISQEVTNRDNEFGGFVTSQQSTTTVGEEVIKEIDNKIVVKEYHDVEYNLDSPKMGAVTTKIDEEKVGNGINWPEPGKVEQRLNVDEIFGGFMMSKEPVPETLPAINTVPITVSPIHESKRENKDFRKPIFGISPTEEQKTAVEEDEFSDFQAAVVPAHSAFPSYDTWLQNSQTTTPTHIPTVPEVAPHINHSMVTNQILLLPTKLERTQESNASALSSAVLGDNMGWSNQLQTSAKINWPEPGVDADELARFEAAFPKKAAAPSPVVPTKRDDEDEWNDFVSHTNTNVPNLSTLQKPKPKTTSVDDEWSDFVSAATITPVSSQFASNRPSFPAWNQPTTQSSYHSNHNREQYDFTNQYQQHTFQSYQSQPKLPSSSAQIRDTVPTIAYNIGDYNFMNPSNRQQQQQQKQPPQAPHPAVDFIAPKKFIGSLGMNGPSSKK